MVNLSNFSLVVHLYKRIQCYHSFTHDTEYMLKMLIEMMKRDSSEVEIDFMLIKSNFLQFGILEVVSIPSVVLQ